MIDVKMMAKSKSGKGGGSSTKTTYIQGTISEAEHATRADKAKAAEKADQADYASKAGEAERANYAAKAGELDADAEVLGRFLRKDLPDENQEVEGPLTFKKAVTVEGNVTMQNGVNVFEESNFYGKVNTEQIENSGKIQTYDLDVTSSAVIKNLTVTGSAHFFELIIDKVKSAGGAAIFTPADGFDAEKVEKMSDGQYKLWWRCEDNNGNRRDSMWLPGDQAICMSFNKADFGGVKNNKYFWAVVTEVSENDGYDSMGWDVNGEVVYGHWIVVSNTLCDGELNPEEGDTIVMLGHRDGYEDGLTDEKRKARQSAIYISAYSSLDRGLTAPIFAQYRGINDFDLASHRKSYWDAKGAKVVGKFELESGEDLEDYIKGNAASGKGFVAAYKYSNGTPSKPTATKNETNLGGGWYNTVPTAAPQWNGWTYDSSAPSLPNDYNWVKSPSIGDSERTYFECVFKTTSDNQEVNFKIQSSSEEKYDFIYISDVDASDVPSKPSLRSQKGDNYISGQNAEILTITKTIAKAGEHHVFVCYAKDVNNGYGSDCGWFTIEGISFTASSPNVLWQSNGTLEGETITSWTAPFRVTGEDGEKGEDGENGKGALEILVSPQTVIFNTNDDGIVPTSTSKTATISCYRDGVKVTNVSCGFNGALNCGGNVQDNGDGTSTVTISNISQEIIDSSTKVSVTSGYVEVSVWDKDMGLYHYIHVPFQVNVSKYTGKMLADNKTFQTKFSEITSRYNSLPLKTNDELTKYTSSIKQTAREISLSVSEKAVGRRNMLYGSAFRKKDEGPRIYLYGDYIGDTYTNGYYGDQGIYKNGGVDGINCLKVKAFYNGSNQQWPGIFYNCTDYDGLGNIKIEKNKKYVISFYFKCDTVGAYVCLEVNYKTSKSSLNTERVGSALIAEGNTYHYFTSDDVGKWILGKVVIDTSNAGDNEYLAVQIWLSHIKTNVLATAWFCRPMMEEGDTYNGWTLSEEDYDYVGGNLLDNAASLEVGGNLIVQESEIKENAFEQGVNARYAKVSSGYKALAQWGINQSGKEIGLQPNTDYIFSFWAKGKSLTAYAYRGDNSAAMVTEDCNGNSRSSSSGDDGNSYFILTSQWKRYWVHWRTRSDKIPQMILLRTYDEAWIAKPKLEVGCTMTDWTEKRTDMVDKQALLATGIDIKNKKITFTADKTLFQNNSGDVMGMFEKDRFNTDMINADEVVAKGIKTQELEAQNLTVTGNSKFGIWSVGVDSRWGKVIKTTGDTVINGVTYMGGIDYCPIFVRGGNADYGSYFRIGTQCAEFSDNPSASTYNGVWFGRAALEVCQGYDRNRLNLPTTYGYKVSWTPAQYIYTRATDKDSPALAIKVLAVNEAGTRTAIQTNGAIRGISAPSTEAIYSSQQISSDTGTVICGNTAEITLSMPVNPVEGQILIAVQRGGGKVNFSKNSVDKSKFWRFNDGSAVDTVNSNARGQINIFVYYGTYWYCSFMSGKM